MLKSFFVLSGEHEELARDEVLAISKSYDKNASIKYESRLVLLKSKVSWDKIANRATFVKLAGTIVDDFDLSRIDIQISRPEKFACRVINLSSRKISSSVLERQLGSVLLKKWNSNVSLSNPDVTIYLIITDSKRYLAYSTAQIKSPRPRKPIKYPHELDWKLGRCMVNLSQLKEGDCICDPFCGTGTILLEAQSMGIKSIGIDFDQRMCDITRKNLSINGFKSIVINSTFDHLLQVKDKIDAIVTDIPYGISSKSSVSPKRLADDFISIVPKQKKLVLVYKRGLDIEGMEKAKKYEIYRHKSLTRVIAVR